MYRNASNILKFVLSTLLLMLFWINGMAQCRQFEIAVSGDTINCIDTNGFKQGKWVVKVPVIRGEPGYEEEGVYLKGKKEGPWRRYHLQGDLIAIENYRWGFKDGLQQYFNMNGGLLEEQSWKAANPEKEMDTVEVYDINDPNKVYMVAVKITGNTMKHGIWKYYDPATRTVVKKENYILDKLDDGSVRPNESTVPNTNNSNTDTQTTQPPIKKELPKPREVLEYEKKNEGKKKVKLRTGQTSG